MINLAEELALAGKPLIELIKDVAKEAVVIAALKVIGMGEGGEPAQQARAEQAPIRIEVVLAGQKDTAAILLAGMDKKRFPARTFVVQAAAQKHKATPVLMK
jgi:hypothetical protein